jgi:hypothetical protein
MQQAHHIGAAALAQREKDGDTLHRPRSRPQMASIIDTTNGVDENLPPANDDDDAQTHDKEQKTAPNTLSPLPAPTVAEMSSPALQNIVAQMQQNLLSRVYLYNKRLTANDVVVLAHAIASCHSLQVCDLAMSGITSDGCVTLCAALQLNAAGRSCEYSFL